jgi:hypothetical protein
MATHLPPGLSPDAVDALTELTSILTRLRAAQKQHQQSTTSSTTTTSSGPGGGGAGTTSTPAPLGVTGTTPLPITSTPGGLNNPHASSSGGGGSTTANGQGGQPPLLSAKDVPFATDNLKHKLQRARQAMRALEDVRRGIAQQEAELKGLGERRRGQAGRLARTQEDGLQFVRSEGLRDGERERELGVGVEAGERMVE